MSETSTEKTQWQLSQKALDKFLGSLHTDRDTAGRQYEQIRSKLIRFFEWRGCHFPEEHADETITRVIRKLDEGDEIRDPSSYCHGVARLVLLEVFKRQEREKGAINQLAETPASPAEDEESEQRLECLKTCLTGLPPDEQQWILEYYQGEGGARIQTRKRVADRLGIGVNALRIRAHRVRDSLDACVGRCLEKSAKSVK